MAGMATMVLEKSLRVLQPGLQARGRHQAWHGLCETSKPNSPPDPFKWCHSLVTKHSTYEPVGPLLFKPQHLKETALLRSRSFYDHVLSDRQLATVALHVVGVGWGLVLHYYLSYERFALKD